MGSTRKWGPVAVRLMREHQGQYSNITAVVTSAAKQLDVSRSRCLAGWSRTRSIPVGGPV